MLIKCKCINFGLDNWHTGIKKYAHNYFHKRHTAFPWNRR